MQCKLDKHGFYTLYSKTGEPFRLPQGSDVNYYLKKGFLAQPPVKEESKAKGKKTQEKE